MKKLEQQNKKARLGNWPGLLLMLCLALGLGILGSQAAEYLLSFRREPVLLAPAPVTRSLLLPADEPPESEKIDVNLATADDFQQVKGIGPALAQAIVEQRDSLGGFFFLEELMDVSGIGEKRFEALRQLFDCPPP